MERYETFDVIDKGELSHEPTAVYLVADVCEQVLPVLERSNRWNRLYLRHMTTSKRAAMKKHIAETGDLITALREGT